ncbi:MAG TPA: hypothetical protein VJ276_06610 [Thermoanaerobaculia bacterium]|nr:hypothetical protein [Thermoanaerobaculia bacterium]
MSRERGVLNGVFIAAVAWQAYVVITAFRYAPRFKDLFSGLGVALLLISVALFETYRFWPIVPLAFALLGARTINDPRSSPRRLGILAALSFAAGFLMQAWLYEGYFAPLFAVMGQIG